MIWIILVCLIITVPAYKMMLSILDEETRK